jgi:IclR family transcriptional regulator, pca regulon regulatory protein
MGKALHAGPAADPDFMTSLARGLAVLQSFSSVNTATISELSKATSLSRAAVRRCLHTLMKLGFAVSDEQRAYRLTPLVLTLGHSYLNSTPLAVSARRALEVLRERIGESCSLGMLDGTDIIYVARAAQARIMAIDIHVGTRLPAYCTSMGRVMLAYLPQNQLDGVLRKVKFERHTPKTVRSASELRGMLSEIREQGFAIVDQELEPGLRSIAVPVQSLQGDVIAALNVGTHAQRVPMRDLQTRILPELKKTANRLLA